VDYSEAGSVVKASQVQEPRRRVKSEHREVCVFALNGLLAHSLREESQEGGGGAGNETGYVWADLGCGKAEALEHVRRAIPDYLRGELTFVGVTRDESDAEDAQGQVGGSGLAGGSYCYARELADLPNGIPNTPSLWARCHLVTLTNVVHELGPTDLASVLCAGVDLLAPNGILVAYDVQELTKAQAFGRQKPVDHGRTEWETRPEWAGLEWPLDMASMVFGRLVAELGATSKTAVVSDWQHQETSGWTALVHRAWLSGLAPGDRVPQEVVSVLDREVAAQVQQMRATWQGRAADLAGRLGRLGDPQDDESLSLAQEMDLELSRLVRRGFALWYHDDRDTRQRNWFGAFLSKLSSAIDEQ